MFRQEEESGGQQSTFHFDQEITAHGEGTADGGAVNLRHST